MFCKITDGFVIQLFDDQGQCHTQEFTATDHTIYRTAVGKPLDVLAIPLQGKVYFPFDMVQPIRGVLMRIEVNFDGFSSVTFDKLGLRVQVSRQHQVAGVFSLTGKSIGALMRRVEGWIDWQSCSNGRSCPVEIFDVVCTMI